MTLTEFRKKKMPGKSLGYSFKDAPVMFLTYLSCMALGTTALIFQKSEQAIICMLGALVLEVVWYLKWRAITSVRYSNYIILEEALTKSPLCLPITVNGREVGHFDTVAVSRNIVEVFDKAFEFFGKLHDGKVILDLIEKTTSYVREYNKYVEERAGALKGTVTVDTVGEPCEATEITMRCKVLRDLAQDVMEAVNTDDEVYFIKTCDKLLAYDYHAWGLTDE